MTSRQIEDAALKGKTCCRVRYHRSAPTSCRFPAKVMRDGKPYCLRHDPVKRAEKRAATTARWMAEAEAERDRQAKAAHLRACERAVVEAAVKRYQASDQGEEYAAWVEEDAAVAAYLEARGK